MFHRGNEADMAENRWTIFVCPRCGACPHCDALDSANENWCYGHGKHDRVHRERVEVVRAAVTEPMVEAAREVIVAEVEESCAPTRDAVYEALTVALNLGAVV